MQPFKSIKFVRQDRLIVLLSKYKFVIVIEFILRKLSGGLKKKKKTPQSQSWQYPCEWRAITVISDPPAWIDSNSVLQHIGLQGTINQSETHQAVIPHSSVPPDFSDFCPVSLPISHFRVAHPPTTHNHQLFIPNCLEESARVQGMGKFMNPDQSKPNAKTLHTWRSSQDRSGGVLGSGNGKIVGGWLCLEGKGKSPSQTTKRHVVNKFSIKFKVTQNKQKRGKHKKKKKQQRKERKTYGGRYPKEHGAEHYITFPCYVPVCGCECVWPRSCGGFHKVFNLQNSQGEVEAMSHSLFALIWPKQQMKKINLVIYNRMKLSNIFF